MLSHDKCSIYEKECSSERPIDEQMQDNEINDEPIPDPNEDSPTTSDKRDSVGGKQMYNNLTDHNYCNSINRDNGDPNGLSPPLSLNRDHEGKRDSVGGKRMYNSCTDHNYCNSVDCNSDDPNGLSPPSSPNGDHERKPSSSSLPRLLDEEVELAHSLVMLSSARPIRHIPLIANPDEPSTSSSIVWPHQNPHISYQNPPILRMFVCKTCKKVFPSHQALGGHRASHKKVKGCYSNQMEIIEPLDEHASKNAENDKQLSIVPLAETPPQQLVKNKSQLHQCAICPRQFLSGQALGGHMRCHWNKSKTDNYGAATQNNRSNYTLDLNEPAPMEEDLTGIPILPDGPATIYYLQSRECNIENNRKEFEKAANENFEDEAESKLVEFEQLIDLKDLNDGDESSTWLQIGIGPNL